VLYGKALLFAKVYEDVERLFGKGLGHSSGLELPVDLAFGKVVALQLVRLVNGHMLVGLPAVGQAEHFLYTVLCFEVLEEILYFLVQGLILIEVNDSHEVGMVEGHAFFVAFGGSNALEEILCYRFLDAHGSPSYRGKANVQFVGIFWRLKFSPKKGVG